MSMIYTITTIAKALDPASKERYGRVGEVRLKVKDVQDLFDDWKRLDKENRELIEYCKTQMKG